MHKGDVLNQRARAPLPASDRASITPTSHFAPRTCICARACEHSCDPVHPFWRILMHACFVCPVQAITPLLAFILEPGDDLGLYQHLRVKSFRLSRCALPDSAAVENAIAGETRLSISCCSCLAGTGGSRSQNLLMYALFRNFFCFISLWMRYGVAWETCL